MDDLATDDQVERMADRVLLRIEERRTRRRAGAVIAVTALLFAGGLGLLLTQLGHGSAGTAASGSGGSAAAVTVVCHTSSARTSSTETVTLKGAPTVRAALDACAAALKDHARSGSDGAASTAPSSTAPASATAASSSASSPPSGVPTAAVSGADDLVACRDTVGRLRVFVKDAHPGTLCVRNDLRSP